MASFLVALVLLAAVHDGIIAHSKPSDVSRNLLGALDSRDSLGALDSDSLEVLHEWVRLDYTWPSPEVRQEAIENGSYIPEHNVLAGVKVYNGDIYVTVPRWTSGVPSTLNKVVTVENQSLLQPYPSWAMQQPDDCEVFQYVQSMEVDPNTGYMWVIDTGRRNIFGYPPGNVSINACPPKLMILDLETDQVIHRYEFPPTVFNYEECFLNDLVIDPEGGYAYISDTGLGPTGHQGGIVVYDMNAGSSHRLEDVSMRPEPEHIHLTIGGVTYTFDVPSDGIALSPDKSLLHYCALGGVTVYQISTAAARDPDVNVTSAVRVLGVKVTQSDGLLMGQRRLYYGCLAGVTCQSALGFWDYRSEMNATGLGLDEVTLETHVTFYSNDDVMTWPDTFAMDDVGYLYVTSNRLNRFNAGTLDFSGEDGANFRVARYPWHDDRSYLYRYELPQAGGGGGSTD